MDNLNYPKGIYLELTNRCNLACPMCRTNAIKGAVLDINLYKEIAKTLFPQGLFVDLRGWGESTILKNFEDYLQIASQYPIKKKIITNGTTLNKRTWKLLAEHKVMTAFSIDALNSTIFKELRGGADVEVVFSNLKLLIREFLKSGNSVEDNIYFISIMSSENLKELPKLITAGADLGIRRFKIEPITLGSENRPKHLNNYKDNVIQCIEELASLSSRRGISIELNAAPIPELSDLNITKKLCMHPFEYVYVNAKGRIGFCDHLNGIEEYTYGHWKEGFHNVWNGKSMLKLRSEHRRRMKMEDRISACEECNWCYHNRFVDLEELVLPAWKDYLAKL